MFRGSVIKISQRDLNKELPSEGELTFRVRKQSKMKRRELGGLSFICVWDEKERSGKKWLAASENMFPQVSIHACCMLSTRHNVSSSKRRFF